MSNPFDDRNMDRRPVSQDVPDPKRTEAKTTFAYEYESKPMSYFENHMAEYPQHLCFLIFHCVFLHLNKFKYCVLCGANEPYKMNNKINKLL